MSLHTLLEDAAVTVKPEVSDVLGELTHASFVYTARQHHQSECGLSCLHCLACEKVLYLLLGQISEPSKSLCFFLPTS